MHHSRTMAKKKRSLTAMAACQCVAVELHRTLHGERKTIRDVVANLRRNTTAYTVAVRSESLGSQLIAEST